MSSFMCLQLSSRNSLERKTVTLKSYEKIVNICQMLDKLQYSWNNIQALIAPVDSRYIHRGSRVDSSSVTEKSASKWPHTVEGVCSIFLRVDRSINKILKPRVLFLIKVFYKKYVFIYYWYFLCSQLCYKIAQILLKCIFLQNWPFLKSALLQ